MSAIVSAGKTGCRAATASLYNVTHERPLCRTVLVADTYWLRLQGLLGRPELESGSGLLLLPSTGIHTFGMRHTIDVVFLDKALQVLRVCAAVAPWQVRTAPEGTHCALELRKGEAAYAGLQIGHQLQLNQAANAVDGAPGSPDTALDFRRWFAPLLALVLCMQVALCCWSFRASLQGQVDLRAYYSAGTAARLLGANTLYNSAVEQRTQQALFHDGWRTLHFLYPPFAVLPYRTLAALPYRSAFVVVTGCSLLCLFATAWLLARHHTRAGVSATTLALCGLCAFSSVIALTQGQLSLVLLLLLALFYCLQQRGLPVLAGLCLSLCLVKVQIALPVAVLYLLWRRYRVVAGFAAGAALLFALSWSVAGIQGVRAYLERLHGLGSVTLLDGAAAHLQYGVQTSTEPNLHGLAVMLLGSGAAGGALTALLSILLLVWASRRTPCVGTSVCAAMLLSYHLVSYDLVLLLLPMALICLHNLQRSAGLNKAALWRTRGDGCLLGCTVLLLCGPVPALLMVLHATGLYAVACAALLVLNQSNETTTTEQQGVSSAREPLQKTLTFA